MSPIVEKMEIFPVAGTDCMELNLSGAHAPYFTRNIVILTDSNGVEGVGEVPGGQKITAALESVKDLVVGTRIVDYKQTLNKVRAWLNANIKDDVRGLQTFDLRTGVHVVTAVEAPLLDLMGKFLDVPAAALLGDGIQRERVRFLSYLFYVGDQKKTDLPYTDESDSDCEWYRIRHNEALTPEAIVAQAKATHEKYGFEDFKLKGGVLEPEEELKAVQALKAAFPDARIDLDPNGCWSLEKSLELAPELKKVLAYCEDPCGAENGFSGREIMREFKNATQFQVATNMIATDWRQFYHTVSLNACDIILADPHFWGFDGTIRMSLLLDSWGLTWGVHSNNHFDITLAAFAQVGATAVGTPAPLDTHWIWQDGQNLLDDTPQIRNGRLQVPDAPGLGVHLNMDRVMAANALYRKLPSHDRDDAKAMQYLIPGWKYDHKKPCLVR